jgi:hypothetical protein
MVKSGVYIRDVYSLNHLNDIINSSGEEMEIIDRDVNVYLKNVRATLKRQLRCIKECLDEAEDNSRGVAKWRRRYREAIIIFNKCQQEIEDYQGFGGGHSLIVNMSEQQVPKASQILRSIVEKLQDILDAEVKTNANML